MELNTAPWGPTLLPSLFAHRGGDKLGPLGVAKPLRLDEHQRPEESLGHPSCLFEGGVVYSAPRGL